MDEYEELKKFESWLKRYKLNLDDAQGFCCEDGVIKMTDVVIKKMTELSYQ